MTTTSYKTKTVDGFSFFYKKNITKYFTKYFNKNESFEVYSNCIVLQSNHKFQFYPGDIIEYITVFINGSDHKISFEHKYYNYKEDYKK
jgi:hypothetical protein